MKVSRRLAIYLFCLFSVLSLAASYPAQAKEKVLRSDYGIEIVGVADQYTLPPDSNGTVMIRLTGPEYRRTSIARSLSSMASAWRLKIGCGKRLVR